MLPSLEHYQNMDKFRGHDVLNLYPYLFNMHASLKWVYLGFTCPHDQNIICIWQDNFVTLLQELRAALDAQGMSLTVAVSPIEDTIDAAYDVPAINGIVDRIHLMTYDFHGPWEDFTHHHSPLYAHPLDSAGNISLNVVSYIVFFKEIHAQSWRNG